MKCANCEKPALWVWTSSYTDDIPYCENDLPRFLYPIRDAGLLQTTEEFSRISATVAEALAPVEEVEEAPKRKRTPRTSVNNESDSDPS
jgi:hypothetical protein